MKTKSIILLFGLFLIFSFSEAQRNYFGVGLANYTEFTGALTVPSIQIGTIGADGSEFRALLDTLILISMFSGDLLYTQSIPDNDLRYYLGGGLDFAIFAFPTQQGVVSSFLMACHLTAGFEAIDGNVGYFGEIQPILGINGVIYGRMRFGLNIGF